MMAPRNGINLDKIVRAATEIIDSNGLEELTLTSLAQKLEIRPPSLYNHVNGVQDVRRLLSIYGLEQLLSVILRAVSGRSGDEAIREMAKAYFRFARTHPGLYEITLMAPAPEDEEMQRVSKEIVELVVRVLAAYRMDPTDAIHAARSLRSLLHGFAALEQRGGFGLPVALDDSYTHMIDTYLAGLHARYPHKSD
ncbi:TetR family transcriptional regulator [Paenibacillus sp. 598K]|nr:TetR family transcriptional regulator [Paenibacillus sp. 598K]